MAQPPPEIIGRVPLFEGLEKRQLSSLANAFKQRRYAAGQKVATEGETGAGFFVIAEGTANVSVDGVQRGTLGPNDYFGEIALIDAGERSATITAETDMVCYGLTQWEFRPIVESDGRIAWKLLQALAQKLRAAEHRS
ncbi:MAG TPA: cyclic nucleotide-binding domain-containing protein [Gaiellaceae bacterium]|jgi:CRP-like cAMP-binding protein|nr:cyclic nucleotide-binding domain-containing protein [Gaiellaceae bacterium]